MNDRCSVCGVDPNEVLQTKPMAIVLTHTLKGRKRTVEWVICGTCELKEMRGPK